MIVPRHPFLSLLVLSLLGLMFGVATAIDAQTPTAPFELSWTSGSCRNCEIVRDLAEVQFTGERNIWAVGDYFPTEGEGAGDNSIVRSDDSGQHWTELVQSRMHASEPSLSFLNRKVGWISGMGDAYPWVLRTNDAGSHWARISNHYIQNMRFINQKIGVGVEFDGTKQLFAKTTDGGHTWTTSSLPGVKFIGKVFFISPEIGWAAGTTDVSDDLNDRIAVVLRTTDGGRHWASFQLPSQQAVADIRDLYFLNESMGWIITWHDNNNGTHLYRTRDGGESWTVDPDATIQGAGRWLSVVRFLNSKIGFVFCRDDEVRPINEPGVAVVGNPQTGPTQSGRLLYTNDGGEHWQSRSLNGWVYDCQVIAQGLGCSAWRDKTSFSILRITLPDSARMSR